MKPVHELAEALRGMRFSVEAGRFALAGFPEAPGPEDFALMRGPGPRQVLREGGETTLFLAEEELPGVLSRHPGALVERGLAWIRFECPMAWDLVGFLALVTGRLAAAGVPLGAVCGFRRDHVFVAEQHLAAAREALLELFPELP
jgi:hypothetical protein